MSKRRTVRRVLKITLFVAVCAAFGFGAVRVYDERMQPDYFRRLAQAASAAGRQAEAKVYLLNLVKEQPTDGEGYLALARLTLAEAAATGKPATYADNRAALNYLAQAARHRPKDVKLQKELLAIYLGAKRTADAYEVARRALAADQTDPDVLTAYAQQAVLLYGEADRELTRLLGDRRAQGYRARMVRVQLDLRKQNGEHLQQSLNEAIGSALGASSDALAALPASESEALFSLLLTGVHHAPDAATTAVRIDQALRIYETTAAAEQKPGTRPAYVGDAADAATYLALFADKQSPPATPPKDDPSPTPAARAEAIRRRAVAVGQASAYAFRYSALAALHRNDPRRALELADLGIAAAQEKSQPAEEFELRLFAGRLLAAVGSPAAQQHIQAMLAAADPKAVGWGHVLAGQVDLALRKPDAALMHYIVACRRLGYVVEVRAGLADSYLALGRWTDALRELAGLAAADPAASQRADEKALAVARTRQWLVDVGRLRAYWGQQAWDDVPAAIDAVTARLPNADSVQAVLQSALHLAAHRPESAQEVSRAAREAHPQDFSLVLNELRVLLATERGDEAERLAEEQAQGQTDVQRLIVLAKMLTTGGRTKAARRLAEQARTAAQGDDAKLLVGAYSGDAAFVRWRKMQDRAALVEAREHYTAMLAIQPRNFLAGNNLAWLLAVDFDEPQEALRIVEQCRGDTAADKLPLTFVDTLAVVYRRAGRPTQAIEVLRSALSRAPQLAELHYQLGLALLADRQQAAGRGELETALTLGLQGDEAVQARQALQALPGE